MPGAWAAMKADLFNLFSCSVLEDLIWLRVAPYQLVPRRDQRR